MSRTAEAPGPTALRRATAVEPATEIDLAPVSARVAVGRYTGIARSRPAAPAPLWKSAGIVGLISLVAAAAAPVIAAFLPLPG